MISIIRRLIYIPLSIVKKLIPVLNSTIKHISLAAIIERIRPITDELITITAFSTHIKAIICSFVAPIFFIMPYAYFLVLLYTDN